MSHDLCLYSSCDEFQLVGSPDADAFGLGRSKVFNGNAGTVIDWYTGYCRALAWPIDKRVMHLARPVYDRDVPGDYDDVWIAFSDSRWPAPEWESPDPVARHIAMLDAFLAFSPDARFGAS